MTAGDLRSFRQQRLHFASQRTIAGTSLFQKRGALARIALPRFVIDKLDLFRPFLGHSILAFSVLEPTTLWLCPSRINVTVDTSQKAVASPGCDEGAVILSMSVSVLSR